MSEEVVTDGLEESPEVADEAPEVTPEPDELTTYKKRLAGKDRALTEAQRKAKALEEELSSLRRWKAEKEEADMTEVERLAKRAEAAEAEAAKARAEAMREKLARKYPLALELFDEEEPLPSETTLAALNERLVAKQSDAEPAPEPRIDPNNPRKGGRPRGDSRTADDILRQIDEQFAGVSFAEGDY